MMSGMCSTLTIAGQTATLSADIRAGRDEEMVEVGEVEAGIERLVGFTFTIMNADYMVQGVQVGLVR